MANHRFTWTILVLGLLLVVNPLYWDILASVGVAPLIDWLGAVGIIPGGTYYLALGGMYLVAGGLALWYGAELTRDVRQVSRRVGASLLAVWAGVLIFLGSTGMDLGVGLVAFALGTGPVLMALLIGANSDRSTTRTLWGISVLLFLPFAVWSIATSMAQGGAATLSGVFILLSVVSFAVLNVIWGYPLYRLGRSLGGHSPPAV